MKRFYSIALLLCVVFGSYAGDLNTQSSAFVKTYISNAITGKTGRDTLVITLPDVMGGVSRWNCEFYYRRMRSDGRMTASAASRDTDSVNVGISLSYGVVNNYVPLLVDSLTIEHPDSVRYGSKHFWGDSIAYRINLAKMLMDSLRFDTVATGYDDWDTPPPQYVIHYSFELPLVQAVRFVFYGVTGNKKSIVKAQFVAVPGSIVQPGLPATTIINNKNP